MDSINDRSLTFSLFSSLILHGLAIVIAGAFMRQGGLGRQDFFNVKLVEIHSANEPTKLLTEKKSPAPVKTGTTRETKPAKKREVARPESAAAPSANDEIAKTVETKPNVPAKAEASVVASRAPVEGGGSEAGAGNLFGKGDVGLVPGTGTAGGGGGTGAAGLGRGAGAPGLPAQQTILRTNREAKPIQTARATYPPMALRMGMEADVTLKILVDQEGNVTKAEILKSGGGGFDEEALKAVKQSRFEPAQRDGQNVAAEFTFIYRFRLQR